MGVFEHVGRHGRLAAELPRQRPVGGAAAGRVARAQREVGAGVDRRDQARDVARVVGEVGVHVQHEIGAAIECPLEAGDVGHTETLSLRAMEHLDRGIGGGDGVGQLARTIGR